MKKKFLVLDCFVDEPACLGVPPFISPYPRYIYGALRDAGAGPGEIEYMTIDTLRGTDYVVPGDYRMIFMIGGAVVPGKYLGARIGTLAEAEKIISRNPSIPFAVGGMIKNLLPDRAGNTIMLGHDIEKYAHTFALGAPVDAPRSTEEISRWAVLGAPVVKAHPNYPNVICEIETSRGCPRETRCSFCVEGLISGVEYRETEDIEREIDTLIGNGVSRFRIGRQADILQFRPDFGTRIKGFPRPDPGPLRELFSFLKAKRDSGVIKTLNIDNANPGTIVNFPGESAEILKIITDAITPGDTMALGVESFDPGVIRLNNLKVGPEEAFEAIRLINEIGGKRVRGVPVLLPGVNLIHGLPGETMETFRINYENLVKIMEAGLLLKRINIRKVLPYPGTALYANQPRIPKKIENRFEFYRSKIRDEIDNFMLKRIYPAGTVIRDSLILESHGEYSYGKEIASYSIALKYPMKLPLNEFRDSVVIGHRERSLMALPFPLGMNSLSMKALELIPGIGKKGASEIILKRPFENIEAMARALHMIAPGVSPAIIQAMVL